ncbi:hypothetical protein HIM_06868 [Hirsutella minnesotensis 3608]|uniref:Aflatoxin regulatory protein domain-containing protein n=1 Tax=Hirsutella minnesotensis 3608 TaxID=1043627 RepID=A0A0F7ZNH3_9HYPO|nr:hypothetical protein HIM_06868 [Hirsutella minnesotensis 3608]
MDLIKALGDDTLSMSSPRVGQRASRGATPSGSDQYPEALPRVRRSAPPGGPAESESPTPSPSNVVTPPAPPDLDLGQDMRLDLGPVLSGLPSPHEPGQTTLDGDLDGRLGHDACSAAYPYNPIDLSNIMEYFSTGVDVLDLPRHGSASPGFPLPAQTAMDLNYSAQQSASSTDLDAKSGLEHSCLRTTKALQQSVVMMTCRDETTHRDHGIVANAQPITTTDQALLTCSSISKQLTEILQCRCEADAYLPFLITVIISKLLATYGAIAKVDESTLFGFGSKLNIHQERNKERSRQQRQQQAAFASVPLRLGAYDVDSELEGALRVQLVLHELSKVEWVLQLFEEKYCYYGEDPKSNERTIYSALGQFIKQRYAATKTACEHRKKSPSLGT